jgi:MFS family permease
MSIAVERPAAPAGTDLLPLMAAVVVVFLITGAALPALPLHIHGRLGFDAFTVGLVSGAQFAAALASRLWAGSFSDGRGPKNAVIAGLVLAALAGLLYLLSLRLAETPVLSVAVLLAGRAVLGGAESFIMVGAQSWGLAVSTSGTTGKVIGWIGTAMFVALAAGAPLGSALFAAYGFQAIGMATVFASLAALALVVPVRPVQRQPQRRGAFGRVARAVWLPGLGAAFASLAYGAMTAFAVLLFVERGWQPAWLSFTAFAVALVAARLALGNLPDRLGGARTAMLFVLVQSAGMALIWVSPFASVGFVGAALTGFGYAFVYPGLGLEAVRRAPPESRGLAMGIYTAFLDVALGFFTPLLGLAAGVAGLGSVFLISALLALSTVPIAARLRPVPHGQAKDMNMAQDPGTLVRRFRRQRSMGPRSAGVD